VRLALADYEPSLARLPLLVSANVTVESGTLGCLLVGEDWTTVLGPEALPVGPGSHTVYLVWERGDVGNLTFRNAGADGRCVFTIAAVRVAPAPADAFRSLPRTQEVPEPWRGPMHLHNLAEHLGNLEFRTAPSQWSYAVGIPAPIPPVDGNLQPVIVVDVLVLEGTIGLGVVSDDMQRHLTSEVDTPASAKPARIELPMKQDGIDARVMVRNTAGGGRPSRFKLLGLSLRFIDRESALLVARPLPEIPETVYGAASMNGVFDILISHSSRLWYAEQCDRSYLRDRWGKTNRLDDLPPFETLPPHDAPYHGLLSVFRLWLSTGAITGRVLRHYDSKEKVVHATAIGNRLLVCLDEGVATFNYPEDADSFDIDTTNAERIDDPWFGGLHTSIPVDETICLLSSSGADAILWLDVSRRQIVKRWRLPAARYGANYTMDETTWLRDHYIPNDLQLGHLNCAAPDGEGGVFFSVLGQGDIGHLHPSGDWDLLASGYVGCHGIRYDSRDHLLYFVDSCSGRLMRVDGPNQVTMLFDAGSRWLHDALHLGAGVFLLTLGDRNRLVLADTNHGRALAEWDFSAVGGSIQFLSGVRSPLA